MNRKGQALVEFVLILPILILILFTIFDFGNMFYSKYELQNQSADIINLYLNGNDKKEILDIYDKLEIDIELYKNDYKKIIISKKINFITPFLDNFFKSPYKIVVERIVPNV